MTLDELKAKERRLGPSRGLMVFKDGMVSLFAYGEIRYIENKPIKIVIYGDDEEAEHGRE
jgi:hypothetical protein